LRIKEYKDLDFAALRAQALEPWLLHLFGNRFASVVAIKGEPGEAESRGKPPFFGADAEALENALVALGWGNNNWCGIALDLPGRDVLDPKELRLLIETIDPRALLALDKKAAEALLDGYGVELLPRIPQAGVKTKLLGRTLVIVDGFEAALASKDEGEAKQRVWKELKALTAHT